MILSSFSSSIQVVPQVPALARDAATPSHPLKEGTMTVTFRERNISLNWFTYYLCFQQQKAENCKMLLGKLAKINAESKKISEPYQEGLLLGSSQSCCCNADCGMEMGNEKSLQDTPTQNMVCVSVSMI